MGGVIGERAPRLLGATKDADSYVSYVTEELTVAWTLLTATVLATYFIQRRRVTAVPPSTCAMLLGVAFGVVCRAAGMYRDLRFSPAAFFFGLLPPIIYHAGWTLKARQFFRNIGAVLTYAVVGTFISALVFGLGTYLLVALRVVSRSSLGGAPLAECLMYGAAISSIDPVATLAVLAAAPVPQFLYNVVFGEAVLNDAVSIVLFRTLAAYHARPISVATVPALFLQFWALAAGSALVGCAVALGCAFLLKRLRAWSAAGGGGGGAGGAPAPRDADAAGAHTPSEFDATLWEIAVVVMGSYLAYLLAEVVGMSGIVALFFAGATNSHYSYYNVSPDAQVALHHFFHFAAFLAETFVFAYLGLQVAVGRHEFSFGLVFSALPLAALSRAANVLPCSWLVNAGRARPLPANLQAMLVACGLRGAVAYGLVVNMPRADGARGGFGVPAIETAALLVVCASTLALGPATGPLLRHFGLWGATDEQLFGPGWAGGGGGGGGDGDADLREGLHGGGEAGARSRFEAALESAVHARFTQLDEAYLKPLFGGKRRDRGGGGGDSAADLRGAELEGSPGSGLR